MFPPLRFSEKWAKSFKKRHAQFLQERTKRGMKAARSGLKTYDQALLFSRTWEKMIQDNLSLHTPIDPNRLVNVDETLLRITQNGRWEPQLVPRATTTGTSAKDPSTVGSMVVFVTAGGRVV